MTLEGSREHPNWHVNCNNFLAGTPIALLKFQAVRRLSTGLAQSNEILPL